MGITKCNETYRGQLHLWSVTWEALPHCWLHHAMHNATDHPLCVSTANNSVLRMSILIGSRWTADSIIQWIRLLPASISFPVMTACWYWAKYVTEIHVNACPTPAWEQKMFLPQKIAAFLWSKYGQYHCTQEGKRTAHCFLSQVLLAAHRYSLWCEFNL